MVTGRERPLCKSPGGLPLSMRVTASYSSQVLHCDVSIAREVIFAGWIVFPSRITPVKSAGDDKLRLNADDAVTLIVGRDVAEESSCSAMARSNGSEEAVNPCWSEACSARESI